MKRSMSLLTVFLALLLGLIAPAANAGTVYEDYYLAGRELSPGFGSGDITYLVLFAGWTLENPVPPSDDPVWDTIAASTGGAWTANIRREGEAGSPEGVTIIGGNWTLQRPDGNTRWGRVLNGYVVWPDDAEHDIGCGLGVATVDADVSLALPWGIPWRKAGAITGCLDDQEWLEDSDTFRLPPRIWAILSLKKW